ncbi:MAG: phosphatidylglycerol lysyltransferase domain-containing protein, partial [Candidatus Delongbacteria bacterium]
DCNSDYIYLTEKLVELKGKKLRKKKNLISQFKRICPKYSVEKLSEEYNETCIELAKRWFRDQTKVKDEDKQLELDVMRRALYNQDKIGLEGILIFDRELLIAFTLFSEQRPDMATIHFEKFDYSYKGAAQIVNQETAICLKDRYKYLNREQDMCKRGLRKSKLSYDPVKIAVTYKLLFRPRKTT